jgi:hypothetical protein
VSDQLRTVVERVLARLHPRADFHSIGFGVSAMEDDLRAALATQPQPDELARLREFVAAHDAVEELITGFTDDRDAYDAAVQRFNRARAAVAGSATPIRSDIPVHAMLDVWMALGGEPAAFYRMWEEDRRTPADTWAQLMAAVGQRLGSLAADTNPPIGPEFDRLIFPAGSATPIGCEGYQTGPEPTDWWCNVHQQCHAPPAVAESATPEENDDD